MRGGLVSAPKTPNAGQSSFLYPEFIESTQPQTPVIKAGQRDSFPVC